jgi:hypothetical protein
MSAFTELLKNGSIDGNCGVVGCWSTNSVGDVYLNGRLIRTKAEDDKYKLEAKNKLNSDQQLLNDAQQQVLLEEKRLLALQNQSQQSFLEKHKTHLLIAGAVVLGFLAYKKFKK